MPVASFEGQFSGASGLRVAIVVARFNDLVTGKLLFGYLDCLGRHGIEVGPTSSQLDWGRAESGGSGPSEERGANIPSSDSAP